jgi:hypothetical protein
MLYVCSLPNPGAGGKPRELFYPDDEAGRRRAQEFVERENGQLGRGIYYCIGTLHDDAPSRSRETVAELSEVVVDIDLKNIIEPRDRAIEVLDTMLLKPSEVRDSGYGLHAVWRLKEPATDDHLTLAESAMKRLAASLAGDPAPTIAPPCCACRER